MNACRVVVLIFAAGTLCVNTAFASQPHRLAFSEKAGVEYFALTDSKGVWCQPEIIVRVSGKTSGFSKSEQFEALTRRVGGMVAVDCPLAKIAQISVFEAGGREPVWVGRASASDGWKPLQVSSSRSANLDECPPRDLDCPAQSVTNSAAHTKPNADPPGTSVHRIGSMGELLKQIDQQKAQSSSTVTSLPPGFPRTPSPRISGASFVGQDLSGKKLAQQKFDGANFTDANLSNADLSGASLKQAVFKGTNMVSARLTGANLTEADLRESSFPLYLGFMNAVFVGANFEGADLKGTDFWHSNLTGANLRNVRNFGQIGMANLSKTDLRGANFLNAVGDLKDLNIKGAIYDDTTAFPLSINPERLGAIRVDVPKPKVEDFSGQDLSSQNFAFQLLDGANFSNATLRSTRLEGSLLRGANFQDADLRNTYLGRAVLSGADLRGATLPFNLGQQGIDLRNANLEGLDLKGTGFFRSNLSGANLKNTKNFGDIFGVNLSNADLRGSNLLTARTGFGFQGESLNLKGAKYNSDTVFPQGFRPETAGMVRLD